MTFDPFKNLVLDEYEQEIEDSLPDELPKNGVKFEARKQELEEAARKHIELRKSKPITLRVDGMDLIKVKARAEKKGIPYQTLLSSLIHNYAEGEVKIEL